MTHPSVYILEKDSAAGEHMLNQLLQIGVPAQWLPTVADLLSESEQSAPVVCLIRLASPVRRILALVADLIQEPRFSQTAFILMGPLQYKHIAFEAGADDYLVTPPNMIELRKRVRLYLDRAELQGRLVAETSIRQEMNALTEADAPSNGSNGEDDPVSLLQHAAALQEERNLLEQILAHTGSAIAMVTPDGTLRYTNTDWKALYSGVPQHTAPEFGWPPVTADSAANRAIATAIEHRRAWRGEVTTELSQQQKLQLRLTLKPIYSINDEFEGYVVVQTDISDRKTSDIQYTRFIADAAAEMRTPVTNIKMRQYLLREVPPEQRGTHLDALERETNRLTNMVEAILELSRMDAQQVPMHFEPVSLYRLASEAIIRYGPAANEKGITLMLTGGEHLPAINIDQTYLMRAVGALITNAIQHTPDNGAITIRLHTVSHAGYTYQGLAVQDDGPGINDEDQLLIFNRFYRSDATRMQGIRGVGLGLSIAQAIVQRHQGLLDVESTLDQGSTFTIWLPAQTT